MDGAHASFAEEVARVRASGIVGHSGRLLDLFGIEHPIIQAPMAGPVSPQMVIAASEAGGAPPVAK